MQTFFDVPISALSTWDEAQILAVFAEQPDYLSGYASTAHSALAGIFIRRQCWQALQYLLLQGWIHLGQIQFAIYANRPGTRHYKPAFAAVVSTYLQHQITVHDPDSSTLLHWALIHNEAGLLHTLLQAYPTLAPAITLQTFADPMTLQAASCKVILQYRPDLLSPLIEAYCAHRPAHLGAVDPTFVQYICTPAIQAALTLPSIHLVLQHMVARWHAYPVAVRSQVLAAFIGHADFEQVRSLYKAGAQVLHATAEGCVLDQIYQKFANRLCLGDVTIFFHEAEKKADHLTDGMCQVLSNIAMRQLGNVAYEKILTSEGEGQYRKRYPHLIDQAAFNFACREPRLRRPFVIWAARNGEVCQFEALMAANNQALVSEAFRETLITFRRDDRAGPPDLRLKLMRRIFEQMPNLHLYLSRGAINRCLQVALDIQNVDILRVLHDHLFVYQGNAKIARQIAQLLGIPSSTPA